MARPPPGTGPRPRPRRRLPCAGPGHGLALGGPEPAPAIGRELVLAEVRLSSLAEEAAPAGAQQADDDPVAPASHRRRPGQLPQRRRPPRGRRQRASCLPRRRRRRETSLWQIAHAATRTCTSPSCGGSRSRSSISSGAPNVLQTAALTASEESGTAGRGARRPSCSACTASRRRGTAGSPTDSVVPCWSARKTASRARWLSRTSRSIASRSHRSATSARKLADDRVVLGLAGQVDELERVGLEVEELVGITRRVDELPGAHGGS